MFGLQPPDRLRPLEALGQRVDKDRIQPVDAFAVVFQHLGGAGDGVGHRGTHFFFIRPDRPDGSVRPRGMPGKPPPMPMPSFMPLAAASMASGDLLARSGAPPLPIICLMACFIMPPLPIFFIMSAICLCCFRSLFSSDTSSPAPAAMRFLRLAASRSGLARSFLVIELMRAIWCFSILSLKPASSAFFVILPMPGIMP